MNRIPGRRDALRVPALGPPARRRTTLEPALPGARLRRVRQLLRRIMGVTGGPGQAFRVAAALGSRDGETAAHLERIGLCSAALGRHLGWRGWDAGELRIAASLHDIGKLGLPRAILHKPGRLDRREFEIVKRHTEIGAAILGGSGLPVLELAREIALRHHERWDGSGYPGGLVGPAIPRSARIVAVVDVYDALVHPRIYRRAVPEQATLAFMRPQRERHFDPEVFDGFVDLLPEIRRIRAGYADSGLGAAAAASS